MVRAQYAPICKDLGRRATAAPEEKQMASQKSLLYCAISFISFYPDANLTLGQAYMSVHILLHLGMISR